MKVEKAAERQSVTTSPTYVFLSGFLCLSAALANFLIYQGYPLLRVEVLFSFSLLAVVSIAMSFLYFYSPGIVKHFWEALIISILVDMHFIDNFAYTLLALAVIFIFLIFLRVSPLRLLAIFGGLVLVTTLFGLRGDVKWPLEISSALGQTQRVERPDYGSKPAIVHIILDEHIGFGGFPAGAKSREARDKLVAYYLDRGFRIYPRAYSEHMHTINSIPSMLNFGEGNAAYADANGMVLGRTKIFEEIKSLGYRLSIYQSGFGDFCSGAEPERCIEYAHESLLPMLKVRMTAGDRTKLIMSKFFKLSDLVFVAQQIPLYASLKAFGSASPIEATVLGDSRSSSVAGMLMFDIVMKDINELRPGEAIFFHSLFPHYPFATTASCEIKPLDSWRMRRDRTSLEERQDAYLDQLRCVASFIDKIVVALDKSEAAGNYVLMIHGDHGSRITGADPLSYMEKYSNQDLAATFSTLAAIKIADTKGGVDNTLAPVSRLLRDFALREFKSHPDIQSVDRAEVILDNANWQPEQRFELPEDLLDELRRERKF